MGAMGSHAMHLDTQEEIVIKAGFDENNTLFEYGHGDPRMASGTTGGRAALEEVGLPMTLQAIDFSILLNQLDLVSTDRTSPIGQVTIRYRDVYVTVDELQVLEEYTPNTPIPAFCPFGFRIDDTKCDMYREMGLAYPLSIRFSDGKPMESPLPTGATLLEEVESFYWYRNFVFWRCVTLEIGCLVTANEWRQLEPFKTSGTNIYDGCYIDR